MYESYFEIWISTRYFEWIRRIVLVSRHRAERGTLIYFRLPGSIAKLYHFWRQLSHFSFLFCSLYFLYFHVTLKIDSSLVIPSYEASTFSKIRHKRRRRVVSHERKWFCSISNSCAISIPFHQTHFKIEIFHENAQFPGCPLECRPLPFHLHFHPLRSIHHSPWPFSTYPLSRDFLSTWTYFSRVPSNGS